MSVALELPQHFLVFRDRGVNIHWLNMSNTDVFPIGTLLDLGSV